LSRGILPVKTLSRIKGLMAAFQGLSNEFEEGWELGEPGVDLGHTVPEVAGILSEGILHQVVLTWRH